MSGKPSIVQVADASYTYSFLTLMNNTPLIKRFAVISVIGALSILTVSCGGGSDAGLGSALPTSSEVLRINALDQNVAVPKEWKTEIESDSSARYLEYVYFTEQQNESDKVQEIFRVGYYDSDIYNTLDSAENSTFSLSDSYSVSMADANSMQLRIYEAEMGQIPDVNYLIALEADITVGDYTIGVFAFGEQRERAILEDFVTQSINSLHVPNSVDLGFALNAGSQGLPEYLGVSRLTITNTEFANGDQAKFEISDLWQHTAIEENGLNIHTYLSPQSSPDDFTESLILAQMSHSDFINDIHANKLIELGIDFPPTEHSLRRISLENGIGKLISDNSHEVFEFYTPSTDQNQDNLDSQTVGYRIANQIYLVNIASHRQNHMPMRYFANNFFESFELDIRQPIVSAETNWSMPIGRILEFAIDPESKLIWISDKDNKTILKLNAYTGEVLAKRVFDVIPNKIYVDTKRNELAVHLTPSSHLQVTLTLGSGLLAILDATSLDTKLSFDSGYEPQQWVQLTNGDIISNTVEVIITGGQYTPIYRTNYISRELEKFTTSIENPVIHNLIAHPAQIGAFAINPGAQSSMVTQTLDSNGVGRLQQARVPIDFAYDAGPFWSIDEGNKIVTSAGGSVATNGAHDSQSIFPSQFTHNSIDELQELPNLNKAISLERFSGTEAVANLSPDAFVLSVYDSNDMSRLRDYIITDPATGFLVGNEKIYLINLFAVDPRTLRDWIIRVDVVDQVSNGF